MCFALSQNTNHEGNNEKQMIGLSVNVKKLFVRKQNTMKNVLVIGKKFPVLDG